MIELAGKKRCCGCGACFNICPMQAIEMKEDEEGFLIPEINREKCVECGKCVEACPEFNHGEEQREVRRAFAIRTKDAAVLRESTSGGIAYEIAKWAIDQGGVACGATYGAENEVVHELVEDVEGLRKLQGSKYVQSRIGDAYQKIKTNLDMNKPVVFVGTPCQVNGLRSFLKKKYDKLINVDFICHGVPSPRVWKAYVRQEKLVGARIVFRDKRKGWKIKSEFLAKKSGKTVKRESVYVNPFYFLFAENYILRECCYNCGFKKGDRNCDITVADCWGIENILKDYSDDDKGMSVCYVHTQKGMDLIRDLKDSVWLQEINYDDAVAENMMMLRSVNRPDSRDYIFDEIQKNGVKKTYRKYKPKESMVLTIKKKLYPIKKMLMR